ncbi:MAG: peptide chain release factor N(5)-glutamine methyltransferase, partial [Gammaproteobacteria bacterium]|nr:peptide chain release factor N(5)-glutamine methyltransferase [Gammaproteobacteria bacterium]
KQGDLRFEPSLALESGTDGLSAIRAISTTAREHLTAPGFLMLEHGFDQAPAVRQLLEQQGYSDIRTIRDLAGHPRVTQAEH